MILYILNSYVSILQKELTYSQEINAGIKTPPQVSKKTKTKKLTKELVTFPPHLGASSGRQTIRLKTSSALASKDDFKQQ